MNAEHKVPRTEFIEKCPACEGKSTKLFFTSPDRLHGTPGEFSYHICTACETVFQNPMVIQEDLHLCYPKEYTPYNYKRDIPNIDFDNLPSDGLKNNLRKSIVDEVKGKSATGSVKTLGKFLAKSKFFRERAFYGLVMDELLPKGKGEHFALDLGCGAGWMMEKLKKVGWQTEGLEWNEEAAQRAREATKCEVFAGDFREINIPKGKYQLIVLNHVFEHFNDPKDSLIRLKELLSDGGKLAMFYPSPNAFGAKWFKTNWFAWEVPRHLILPSVKALELLSKNTGFTKANIYTRAYYSIEQWKNSKAYVNKLNPDIERLDLGVSEKIGLTIEKSLSAIGLETGWELVAILEK